MTPSIMQNTDIYHFSHRIFKLTMTLKAISSKPEFTNRETKLLRDGAVPSRPFIQKGDSDQNPRALILIQCSSQLISQPGSDHSALAFLFDNNNIFYFHF